MPKLFDHQLEDGNSTLAGVHCSVHSFYLRFIFLGEAYNDKSKSKRNAQIWVNESRTGQLCRKEYSMMFNNSCIQVIKERLY